VFKRVSHERSIKIYLKRVKNNLDYFVPPRSIVRRTMPAGAFGANGQPRAAKYRLFFL
jgi:hypothetical protein